MATWRPTRRWCWRGRRGMAPRDIAEALAGTLAGRDGIVSAEVAGPGFLNLRLRAGALVRGDPAGAGRGRRLRPLRRSAPGGRSTSSSSRPIRPGRCMSAMCAARCSATRSPACSTSPAGTVTREYYINDGGAQVDVLARSAYERYREACGLEPAIAEGLYPGDYLIPVGEALKARYGDQPARPAGSGLAGGGPRDRHRGDDGDDPRRSRAAPGDDGPLLLGEVALRHRPDRGGAGRR